MNIAKSEQAAKQSKFKIFIQWFCKNGGKYSSEELIFPAIFQPGSYLGVAAANNIKKNKVILAVPQSIIISLTRVKNSQLSPLLKKNQLFTDEEDPDTQFNLLAIFIIYQKMKGKQSFFYPFLNCLDYPQTILSWTKQQIIKVGDPYLKQYALELKQQYQPLFQKFLKFTLTNKKFFPEKLTYQLFIQAYSIVMTRCFGWGLPQTMLIPFADFMNHESQGVNHYMLNSKYQKGQEKTHSDYIVKNSYLDLSLFGIPSKQFKKYEPNQRVKFIKSIKPQIPEEQIIEKQKYLLQQIHKKLLLQKPISTPLLKSQDQQDNDSDQEQQNILSQPNFLNLLKKQKPFIGSKDILKQKRFQRPKLPINRQFQQHIQWGWWKFDDKQTYFIVSTASEMKKYEQIYNSYGKRSNRFLLIWYGFTLEQNKYNSVPFRLWMWKGQNLKKKSLIFERRVGDEQWDNGIVIDNEIFPTDLLTRQFKLKQTCICQQLVVYLRFHLINTSNEYLQALTKQDSNLKITYPSQIKFQIQVFELLMTLISELCKIYDVNSIQKDYQLLSKQGLHFKQIFSLRMKISNKKILLIQRTIVGMIIQILKDLHNKIPFQQAYKTVRLQYQNDKLFRNKQGPVFYRKKIIEYLRTLNTIL